MAFLIFGSLSSFFSFFSGWPSSSPWNSFSLFNSCNLFSWPLSVIAIRFSKHSLYSPDHLLCYAPMLCKDSSLKNVHHAELPYSLVNGQAVQLFDCFIGLKFKPWTVCRLLFFFGFSYCPLQDYATLIRHIDVVLFLKVDKHTSEEVQTL